jgi:hypothetical protein
MLGTEFIGRLVPTSGVYRRIEGGISAVKVVSCIGPPHQALVLPFNEGDPAQAGARGRQGFALATKNL